MKSIQSEMVGVPCIQVTVRPQYSHATLQLRRNLNTMRLRAVVSSFEPGNPDPVRVEIGELATLSPALRRRYPDIVDVTLATLNAAGSEVGFLNEVFMDMDPDAYWNVGEDAYV